MDLYNALEAVAFYSGDSERADTEKETKQDKEKKKKTEDVYSVSSNNEFYIDNAIEGYLSILSECQHILDKCISYILNENSILNEELRLQDEVKFKWRETINTCQKSVNKFNYKLQKLIGQQRTFLNLYKNILLNSKWREDQTYKYNGDYKVAIDRCLHTKLPELSYESHIQFINQDGYEAIINRIMAGHSFDFNNNSQDNNNVNNSDIEKLNTYFRRYFLALDRGESSGTFSDLNPKEIYDFCFNYTNLSTIANSDLEAIKRVDNLLPSIVDRLQRSKGEESNTTTPSSPVTNPQTNNIVKQSEPENKSTSGVSNVNASMIIDSKSGKWIPLLEEDNQNNSTNLKVSINTNAQPVNKPQTNNTNTTNNEHESKIKPRTAEQDMDIIIEKWSNICKAFIASKFTALYKILSDYMQILYLVQVGYNNK